MVRVKRKRLFEEDAQPQLVIQNTMQQNLQQQNNQLNQQLQLAQQPNLQNNLQPNQQLQQPNLQNNLQPNQQLQLNQLQQQNNNIQEKVGLLLNTMQNTYWLIAVNVPEEIQKVIPEFKLGNQEADPIIKQWDAFKQNPNETTFTDFINGFKMFGRPQQNQLQTNNQEQLNVNASYKLEYSFKKNLSENLKRNQEHKRLYKQVQELGLFE